LEEIYSRDLNVAAASYSNIDNPQEKPE